MQRNAYLRTIVFTCLALAYFSDLSSALPTTNNTIEVEHSTGKGGVFAEVISYSWETSNTIHAVSNGPNPAKNPNYCDVATGAAIGAAKRLQSPTWFNPADCKVICGPPCVIRCWDGYYKGNIAWTDANSAEDLVLLTSLTGDKQWAEQTATINIKPSRLEDKVDDAGWGALYYIKASDSGVASITKDATKNAARLQAFMAKQEDGVCGGGVYWDGKKDFKNTISNALYMHVSASMVWHSDRSQRDKYAKAAQNTWNFLSTSGLRDSDGLWMDGVHPKNGKCDNIDGKQKWTYNQGVIVSGLALMYKLKGDAKYLDEAEITINAVIKYMTTNGILREIQCDETPTGSRCNEDQRIFKGIFMKHLIYYFDIAKTDTTKARLKPYEDFLWAQSSGVYHYATNGNNDPGNLWYAPCKGGCTWTPRTVTAGLDAHMAAAKYGTCGMYEYKGPQVCPDDGC